MEAKMRNCQNCETEFAIEAEDFVFYAKISVPPPTFCPKCRLQRRLAFRNERTLYRRECGLCGRNIVARYDKEAPFPVYCAPCWFSDKWDPLRYGRPYDFSRNFFEQFKEFRDSVPHPALYVIRAVNSEYANQALDIKNVYLSVSILHSQDIYYSYRIDRSSDLFDCAYTWKAEQCYEGINIENSHNVLFSQYVEGSFDSEFLYDVRGAKYCFGCVNLRNPEYQMFNEHCSKEEYEKRRSAVDLGSYQVLEETKKRYKNFQRKFPKRFAVIGPTSVNVVGDNVFSSKNCFWCFDSNHIEDSKYILATTEGAKNCYDLNHSGENVEYSYESWSTSGSRNKFNSSALGQNVEYSEFCSSRGCADLFGCVSITGKKQYCIFNKQYTKEEYAELRENIITHMSEKPYVREMRGGNGEVRMIEYRYGEFFPPELSSHGYNETIALDYFPLSKEEAEAQGYLWKDRERKNYQITASHSQLPDHIKDVGDDILGEIIGCAHADSAGIECSEQCTLAFKIIPQELQFYRKMNLPLPRLCPNCRHYQRLKQRNPLRLWHRQCACGGVKSDNGLYANTNLHFHGSEHCPDKFETSYAPQGQELVYCERCYQAEVV